MPHDNSTFPSRDQDKHLSKYRASFELYPYMETQEYSLFKGQLTGQFGKKGVRHGQFCIVRTMTNTHPGFEDWESFLECSKHARLLAKEFNNIVLQRTAVTFSVPMRAEMDTVWNRRSLLGRMVLALKPHRKCLKEGEVVVLEENLGKTTSTYIHDLGFVGSDECDVLQAFGHFTWLFTNGQLVICGLKGIRKSNGQFHLTDPVVHSAQQLSSICSSSGSSVRNTRYGPRDMCEAGITSFFKFHRCNDICRHMPTPTSYSTANGGIVDELLLGLNPTLPLRRNCLTVNDVQFHYR